ncbi:MAG: aminotransferase class I/II-fold pyridoxal phosphate-dependent enzyme [Leptolyngbya sp. PLA3]|nr:MAG: aminotransferase class I/II-fold pyridoxal phosphate-dependent enzyme [Cyanobacteria bacterium CYA]MCE7969222.1 aminotransferase class I/II-fold pyridoxal phosphate-dependent enzyme [Leptolyngbya sp. PL-A3]
MPTVIDLRSDTVTQPTEGMRRAMMNAPLGDDTLGDEPTVKRLEQHVADLLGKESAVFVPSGTMANLLAIRSQTEPGDEIICHPDSHIQHYEGGGYAAVAGCSIRFAPGNRGIFSPDDARPLVRHSDHHFPRTRLVSIENTMNRGGGAIWPLEALRAIDQFAHGLGLRVHMDGARLWNAAVAMNVAPSKLAAHADTVSCCFSKGLGCPAGSALAGDAGTIVRARRFRKMLGGSMRQSGLLAGAALYALEHQYERLADDHAHAQLLARHLSGITGLCCDAGAVDTNMVYFDVEPGIGTAPALCEKLEAAGVRMLAESPTRIRAVCHLGVTRADVEEAGRRIARLV